VVYARYLLPGICPPSTRFVGSPVLLRGAHRLPCWSQSCTKVTRGWRNYTFSSGVAESRCFREGMCPFSPQEITLFSQETALFGPTIPLQRVNSHKDVRNLLTPLLLTESARKVLSRSLTVTRIPQLLPVLKGRLRPSVTFCSFRDLIPGLIPSCTFLLPLAVLLSFNKRSIIVG